jgi:NADH dehydrogenase
MQMAKHVARLIEDDLAAPRPGEGPRPAFDYWDRGTMATIGRSAAVAKIGALQFSGFLAWLAWLGVHLVFLVGFRNKIAVFFNWIYSYFTYKRGMRIVTGVAEEAQRCDHRETPATASIPAAPAPPSDQVSPSAAVSSAAHSHSPWPGHNEPMPGAMNLPVPRVWRKYRASVPWLNLQSRHALAWSCHGLA